MDDSELIRLAGLAAGFEYSAEANPLIDDALALRLAVRLKLEITRDEFQIVVTDGRWHEKGVDVMGASEPLGADDYAATRRAVVRAAAAIGGYRE